MYSNSKLLPFWNIGIKNVYIKRKHRASELGWDDFEDAVQNVTAEHVHADYIITRNVKDFVKNNIAVFTPSEFIDRL